MLGVSTQDVSSNPSQFAKQNILNLESAASRRSNSMDVGMRCANSIKYQVVILSLGLDNINTPLGAQIKTAMRNSRIMWAKARNTRVRYAT